MSIMTKSIKLVINIKNYGEVTPFSGFLFLSVCKKKYTYKSDIYIITDKRHLKKELENIYER